MDADSIPRQQSQGGSKEPFMGPHSRNSLEFLLSSRSITEHVRRVLEGYMFDESTKQYYAYNPPFTELVVNGETVIKPTPLLKELGISYVVRTVAFVAHEHAALTILDEEDARMFSETVHRAIAGVFFIHEKRIGIQADDIRSLSLYIGMNVFFFLMRSVNGETLKRLTQFYAIREDRTGEDKKTGWFG